MIDLSRAELELELSSIQAITLAFAGNERGFQVSVNVKGGWNVFYGHSLGETIERAVNCGPQVKSMKVVNAPAVTVGINLNDDEDCTPTPGGVVLEFNSNKW